MRIDQLQEVQKAVPFRPYHMNLARGRSVDVVHPDFVARSPTGRAVIVYKQDESFEVVDLLLVASLEILHGRTNENSQDA